MRIATFNIGSLAEGNQIIKERLDQLVGLIEGFECDYVCFQEFPESLTFEGCDLANHLMNVTHLSSNVRQTCSPSHTNSDSSLALAVFSRHPGLRLVSMHKLVNPQIEYTYKGNVEKTHDKWAILCEGDDGAGGRVAIVCAHLLPFYRFSAYDNERTREAVEAVAKSHRDVFDDLQGWIGDCAATHPGSRLVVCADMNLGAPLFALPSLAQTHFDVFDDEPTRPSGKKSDAILLPKDAQLQERHNVPTLMDHNFLVCQAEWAPS